MAIISLITKQSAQTMTLSFFQKLFGTAKIPSPQALRFLECYSQSWHLKTSKWYWPGKVLTRDLGAMRGSEQISYCGLSQNCLLAFGDLLHICQPSREDGHEGAEYLK